MTLRNSLFLLVWFTLFSCDKNRVFDQYKSTGESWHKDSIVSFDFTPKDSTQKYNLFLTVRNNNNYPFQNLFLIVEMNQGNKKSIIDTLEYVMANPDGTLLGNGMTDTKESKLFYKENFTFSHTQPHTFYIQQAVRQQNKIEGVENLEGITEIGLRIETIK